MLRVAEPLPLLTLQDAQGHATPLRSLHAAAPLAAIFLRHFG